jgi:hypothetical protein
MFAHTRHCGLLGWSVPVYVLGIQPYLEIFVIIQQNSLHIINMFSPRATEYFSYETARDQSEQGIMLSTLCNSFDYSPVLPRSDYVLIFSQCTNIHFTTFSHCAPTKILQLFLTVHLQIFYKIFSPCTYSYMYFTTVSHCAPKYIVIATFYHRAPTYILQHFLTVHLHRFHTIFSMCTYFFIVHLHIFYNTFLLCTYIDFATFSTDEHSEDIHTVQAHCSSNYRKNKAQRHTLEKVQRKL